MLDCLEDVLAKKTDDEIRNYGIQHPADLAYRVELSRRISVAFDNADTLLIFDDIDQVLTESDRVQSSAYIKYLVDENGQILSRCNHRQK